MSFLNRPFVIALALCWLLLPAGIPAAAAQKGKEPKLGPAPPPVVGGTASVYAGSSVEIPLLIHGRRGEQLEFLIRNPPKIGKLSRVTPTTANSAVVTYTAPASTAVTEDRFTYAVRSSEGVSAPAIITVTLRTKPVLPGRLEAPEAVAFTDTVIGEQSTAQVEITNPGSGVTNGRIEVTAPWIVEGTADYRLNAKGKATFQLIFRPESAGPIKGEAVFGPAPRKVVLLTGEALPPVLVKPARLKIAATERGQNRLGTVEIENLAMAAQVVELSSDARLTTDKRVKLGSGEKAQVPVLAEPGDGNGFETTIRVSAGKWKQEIPVEVEALKSRLKLIADAPAALTGFANRPTEFGVTLENEGGRAIEATVSVNPPFRLVKPTVSIAAGEKVRIPIKSDEIGLGEHPVEVTATSEAMLQRVKFVYVATVDPNDRPQPRTPAPPLMPSVPVAAVGSLPPENATEGARNTPAGPRPALHAPGSTLRLENHPNALGQFAQLVGSDRATLSWPAQMGGKSGTVVEERTLSVDAQRDLTVKWVKMDATPAQAEGDRLRLELRGLQPARLYTARARSGDETLFTVQFTTKEPASFMNFGWRGALLGFLGVTLGVLGWRWWKGRNRSQW